MNKSTMLMEYENFIDTKHLQEDISNQGFKRNVDVIQKNAELDSKSNGAFVNDIANKSQDNLLDGNADRGKGKDITFIGQNNKIKLENINNVLKFIFNLYKSTEVDSFYSDIKEWHGVVESIDLESKKFKVLFSDVFGDGKYIVEFDMGDMQFPSDLDLLQVGVNIVWVFGHETKIIKVDDKIKQGSITNVSRLTIRRTRVLTKKQIKEAEEDAENWTEFFRRCKPED